MKRIFTTHSCEKQIYKKNTFFKNGEKAEKKRRKSATIVKFISKSEFSGVSYMCT